MTKVLFLPEIVDKFLELAEGREEGLLASAQRMLAMLMLLEVIAAATSLTVE